MVYLHDWGDLLASWIRIKQNVVSLWRFPRLKLMKANHENNSYEIKFKICDRKRGGIYSRKMKKERLYTWFRLYICKQQKVKSARLKEVKRSNHTLRLCFKFTVSENIMSITLKRTPTVIKKLKLWKNMLKGLRVELLLMRNGYIR